MTRKSIPQEGPSACFGPESDIHDLVDLAAQPLTGPIEGRYLDGNVHGEFVAKAYLQRLRTDEALQFLGGGLQHIVFRYAEHLNASSGGELDGVRGQVVGLCSVVDAWLKFAVQHATGEALRLTADQINAGLADAVDGGPAREWMAKVRAGKSAQASAAAKARWAKHSAKEASHA